MRKMDRQQDRSKFTALENHFLNTFFSGLYISATDLLEVAKRVDVALQMNTREQLIKDLLNKSFENNTLAQTSQHLSTLIDTRIQAYQKLSMHYHGSSKILQNLINRANSTKALLVRESRGNVYER